MKIQTFPLRLIESFMLSQKVKHFVFEVVRESTFSYVPGQFITIHFEKDGKALKRSYSVANQPMNNNRIEFAAGYVDGGPATELLFGLQPGDTLNASGPFGRLILKEDTPKRYILVATSTGVTPYRAMLPSLRQRLHDNPELEVVILQGVQCADEILYVDEFQSFEKEYDTAQFYACLSRCQSSDLTNSNQRVGYVQHCFEALAVNPETDVIYLCGNPGMIDDAFAWLKEKGFVTQQIIREKYISR